MEVRLAGLTPNFSRKPILENRCWVASPYGVRSAVTRRACRIAFGALEPATRRHEASKLGQACCEQSRPAVWMSSRSPLARACGTLASTSGAKPGRMASAAATHAATATAEIALIIMTVPNVEPLGPSFMVNGVQDGCFGMSSPRAKVVSSGRSFVSSWPWGRNKTARMARAAMLEVVLRPKKNGAPVVGGDCPGPDRLASPAGAG